MTQYKSGEEIEIQMSGADLSQEKWVPDTFKSYITALDRPYRYNVELPNGNESNVKSRTKEKINQTNISDSMKIPAYISVVEFSKPMASFVEK